MICRRSSIFKIFAPIGSHVNENEKHSKYERNPCTKFRDNCDTDGWTDGRTDDGPTDERRRTTDDGQIAISLETLSKLPTAIVELKSETNPRNRYNGDPTATWPTVGRRPTKDNRQI